MCEGQHNLSPEDFALSSRTRGKNCQLPWRGRVGVSFRQNRIGLDRPRERGRGLIPPGASHVSRGAARRNGHSPAPQCTAGRVTRSGGFWLDRYGPAPPSSRLSLLRVVRTPGWPLPSLFSSPATAPDSRPRDYRPTYPGQELSSWRGGRERGVVGVAELWRGGIAGTSSPTT